MTIGNLYRSFRDRNGAHISWFRRDRFNMLGQHNPHKEYSLEQEIENCIQSPDEIRQDSTHKERECLYKRYTDENGIQLTLKCVISYRKIRKLRAGILITAYNAKPGASEKIIWKKLN